MLGELSQVAIWNIAAIEARNIADAVQHSDDLSGLRQRIDDLADVVLTYADDAQRLFWQDMVRLAPAGATMLGRRILLEFLAIRAFDIQGIQAVLQNPSGVPGPTIREKLFFTRALINLVAPLMREIGSDDPSAIKIDAEDVIHILAEIAQRRFRLEGAIDIEGALRSFIKVEPALYLWREAYRDHLLHVADVCLLGWMLLDSTLPGTDETLGSYVAAMMGTSQDYVYGNWFLAALLHDVGYAVDVIRQAVLNVDYLKSSYLERLRGEVNEVMRGVGALIEEAVLAELPGRDLQGLDHGVLSYLHVTETLDRAVGSISRRQKFRPACEAILKHSLKVPVSLASEPLTALLILCDELQEWERPRVSGRSLAAHSREVTGGAGQVDVPSASISESLMLNGLEVQGGRFCFAGNDLECILTYRPPEIGKFRPQRVCLEKCHNIQRLDPAGFPLRLRLTLVNQYLSSMATKECGLEALRSYALRYPELGLIEFVDGRRDGIQVIRFTTQPGNIESLSFDVERLNRIPLLSEKLDVNWENFAKWAVYCPDPYELEPPPLLREDT